LSYAPDSGLTSRMPALPAFTRANFSIVALHRIAHPSIENSPLRARRSRSDLEGIQTRAFGTAAPHRKRPFGAWWTWRCTAALDHGSASGLAGHGPSGCQNQAGTERDARAAPSPLVRFYWAQQR